MVLEVEFSNILNTKAIKMVIISDFYTSSKLVNLVFKACGHLQDITVRKNLKLTDHIENAIPLL